METIKFENKEYVWQEVEGKGKCLVPYVKPEPKFKVGDIVKHVFGEIAIVSELGGRFGFIRLDASYTQNKLGTAFWPMDGVFNSIEELNASRHCEDLSKIEKVTVKNAK